MCIRDRHYGGDVAGPVFSKVMGGALRTLGIAQDAMVQEAKGESGKLAKGPAQKEKL